MSTVTAAGRIRTALPVRPGAALVLALVSLLGVGCFCWPLLLAAHGGGAGGNSAHAADAPYVVALLLPLLIAVLGAELARGGIDAKAIAVLGVLVACGTALRPLSTGLTSFQPLFFLLLPAGRVFGRGFGFVLGALTLFASAFVTAAGVGPYLPFQMLAAGWVGFGAGCLPLRLTGRAEIWALAAYGLVAGLAYGAVMDLWFWPYVRDVRGISFIPGETLAATAAHFTRFYVTTSLGYDLPRGVGMAVLTVVAGRPVLAALHRAARRASFGAVATFVPPAAAAQPRPLTAAPVSAGAAGD